MIKRKKRERKVRKERREKRQRRERRKKGRKSRERTQSNQRSYQTIECGYFDEIDNEYCHCFSFASYVDSHCMPSNQNCTSQTWIDLLNELLHQRIN